MQIAVGAVGRVPSTIGCPLWGNSPETVVGQVVAEEFGIDPSDVSVDLRRLHARRDLGRARAAAA